MTTFADLKIPFPLFDAPTQEAGDYVGLSRCCVCKNEEKHCFSLGVGRGLIRGCSACGEENGLDVTDRADMKCRKCAGIVRFPLDLHDESLRICYVCLRAGRAAFTKMTEYGMVSWEQAFEGVTHGSPGLECDEFERVLISAEEDWWGVRVPKEHLIELVRTPT